MPAGRAIIEFDVQGVGASLRSIRDLGQNFDKLTTGISAIGQKLSFMQEVFGLISQAGAGAYQAIIGANEELNASLLKSQTVLAQNLQVFNANGVAVDGISDKITSFGSALRENRKQLELNTKELVGVTSAFTFGVFDNVLLQFQNLNGQTKKFNSDLEGATELASNLTAALSSLNLTNDVQATQEVRALLSGDVNNPGAQLAKTIGLSKEEFLRAKATGELIDVLNAKLEPFRAGNALGAVTIANEISNITDAIEVFARTIGEGVGEDVAVVLNKYRLELEKALGNEQLIAKGNKLVSLIAETASAALDAGVEVGKVFGNAGVFEGAFEIFDTSVAGTKALAENIAAAANNINELLAGLDAVAAKLPLFSKEEKDIGIFARAFNSVRDPISFFNGDLARSKELIGIQKDAFERSNATLGKYSQLITEAAGNTKEFQSRLSSTGASSLLESLSNFDPTATGPEEARIQNVQRLRSVLAGLNLENEKQVLETINKLAEEEQNATLDNFQLRQRLSKQIQVQVASGTDLQRLKPEINAEIVAIEEQIKANEKLRLAGKQNRVQAEEQNDLLDDRIRLLKEQAKTAGVDLDAEDTFSAANEIKGLGTALEQALSTYENAIAGFKGATDQASLVQAADELVQSTTDAFTRGAIGQAAAAETLQGVAKSTKLTNEQRAKAEQALTSIISSSSEVRQAAIKAEIAAIKQAEAAGQISGNESRLQQQNKAIEQAKVGIQDLQAQLELAIALAEGVETKQIQVLRQQIAENVSNLAGLEADTIIIAYQNGIKGIEEAKQDFEALVAQQRANNQIAITQLEASGQTTSSQSAINQQIANQALLQEQIEATSQSLLELNGLQAGASEASQRELLVSIRQEENKLIQQKADLLRGELDLEKALNAEFIKQQQLAIKRRDQAQELINAQSALAIESASITEEARTELKHVEQLKSAVTNRLNVEQELSLVLQRQTATADEEEQKANEVHRLRVAILTAKQQEAIIGRQISTTEQQAIDASAQAMKQRFSNAQLLLSTIQQKAEEAGQAISKELDQKSQGVSNEINSLQKVSNLRQQIAAADEAKDKARGDFLRQQLQGIDKKGLNGNTLTVNPGKADTDKQVALEIEKRILKKQEEQTAIQEKQRAQQEARQAEQQAFAAQQQVIAQQIASIEIQASLIKLENQKEALKLKKEELALQGFLTQSVEASIDTQIANTEELISINREQGRIQNIGVEASKKRADKALISAGISPEKFSRNTLQPVDAGLTFSQVKSNNKQISESGETRSLGQTIADAIRLGFESSSTNADSSKQVIVNNNFANLSDERAMRRTIGI